MSLKATLCIYLFISIIRLFLHLISFVSVAREKTRICNQKRLHMLHLLTRLMHLNQLFSSHFCNAHALFNCNVRRCRLLVFVFNRLCLEEIATCRRIYVKLNYRYQNSINNSQNVNNFCNRINSFKDCTDCSEPVIDDDCWILKHCVVWWWLDVKERRRPFFHFCRSINRFSMDSYSTMLQSVKNKGKSHDW